MKNLTLSPGIHLPIELTTRRSVVFGMSGSGKSNTATVCIEQLLAAGEQVVLIDPKGEGWGLQSSADGKHPGHEVIVFGHARGDIPVLREEHAEQIAAFVVESGRSVILSLQDFESDQAERRFVTRFFKRLYRLKSQQAHKTRLLVVLEEAHLFVPENASGPSGEMVSAIKRIARQGRAAGMGLMVVDQRPQEVAKSIISQAELLICHQLAHKLDRDALRDWIRAYDTGNQGEAFLQSLALLKPGEAWVWSPAWLHIFQRAHIDRRQTFDSGATPDGSAASAPKARAHVDLEALRVHLDKIVQETAENDPKVLKARIKELERTKNFPIHQIAATTAQLANARISGVDEERSRWSRHVRQTLEVARANFLREFESLSAQFRNPNFFYETVSEPSGQARPPYAATQRITPPDVNIPHPIKIPGIKIPSSGTATIGKAERKILSILAQYLGGCTKKKLALVAGYSAKGGGFNNALSSLRTQGFIEGSDPLKITEAGFQALGDTYEPLPTGEALLQHWYSQLGKAERAILEVLAKTYPLTANKERVAEVAGYAAEGGGFNNALSRLRTLELITGSKELRASEELFS